MRKHLLFSLLLTAAALTAQDNQQGIYDDNILAVQFHLIGAPLTHPIVDLNAPPNTLVLEFDRLGASIMDYTYTIRHCDSDWRTSDLETNEYIDGFTEDRLTDFQNSFSTLTPYVHYRIALPNRNMRWTRSGNYLIEIYDEGQERVVLSRRFMVSESRWHAVTDFVKPAQVSKLNTHQEIDFSVSTKGMRVSYPQREVKAYILQNGRWDHAIGPVPPFVVRQDMLVFDYQDSIVFPAGKEFRRFDMRTFEYRGEGIKNMVRLMDYYEVTLFTDESRGGRTHVAYADLDGRFSIENLTPNQGLDQCDYAEVLFSLKRSMPEETHDVYVYGELSDWQLKPEFRMRWDAEVNAYVCFAFLKQGYYNYKYVLVDRQTGAMDEETLEGNWHESTNNYTILVYYRPFGERYDRLMLSATMDSRNPR